MITPAMIIFWRPCWSKERVVEAFRGRTSVTPEEVLRVSVSGSGVLSPAEALWVVLHDGVLSARVLCLFALDCTARMLRNVPNTGYEPDGQKGYVMEVLRRFVQGEAPEKELTAAVKSAQKVAEALEVGADDGNGSTWAVWACAEAVLISSELVSSPTVEGVEAITWYATEAVLSIATKEFAAVADAERLRQAERLLELLNASKGITE